MADDFHRQERINRVADRKYRNQPHLAHQIPLDRLILADYTELSLSKAHKRVMRPIQNYEFCVLPVDFSGVFRVSNHLLRLAETYHLRQMQITSAQKI